MRPAIPPKLIGNRYEVGEQLGAGGMGSIFHAVDRLTGDVRAIKRVRLDHTQDEEEARATRLALTREFATLASLRHPNIIGVLDYGFDAEQNPYFVMPLLDNAMPFHEAAWQKDDLDKAHLLIEMLQALAYIHRRGIVHRDLKPGNVLVTHDDSVKVLDFGLAIEGDTGDAMAGTFFYMAPEILQEQGATPRSDLYGFGVMLYEVFTGQLPFNDPNLGTLIPQILYEAPDYTLLPYELDVDNHVSDTPDLIEIAERLLAKDPAERYDTCEAAIADISALAGLDTLTETTAIRESYLQAAQFVGRDEELTTLLDALSLATAGTGSSLLVGGVSGVGKSRLLDELRVQALVSGAMVLRGQTTDEGRLPYQVWREPVRRLLLGTELSPLEASILKEIVPDISNVLNRDVPDAPSLAGSDAQERLSLAIVSLFRTQQQPMVLILEDLQWAAESLIPLQALLRVVQDLPLLVIASYRSDEAPHLPQTLPDMQQLLLKRLNNDAMRELAASMLGDIGERHEVLELLERETEGNVFFVVETVRALAESAGSLGNITAMDLPKQVFAGGVRDVVQRRLGYVPSDHRPLLNLAAIAGRELDLDLLEAIIAASHDPAFGRVSLDSWLTTCANVAIFTTLDGRWRFAHDKLRETVIEELPASDARKLHRQTAETIELLRPDDQAQARALAEHWLGAGDVQRAATYAIIAATQSLNTGDPTEAQALLQRVLASDIDTRTRMTAFKLIGDTYEAQAQYDVASAYYEQCLELAQQLQDAQGIAIALDGKGDIADKRGDLETAQTHYADALEAARAASLTPQIAETLKGLGTVAAKRGRLDDAVANFNEALTLNRQLDDQRGIAANLNNLGIVKRLQGQLDAAQPLYEEALQIREEIGDKRGIAATLTNLGILARNMQNDDLALTYYQRGTEIFREIGDLNGSATILNNIGIIHLENDELDAAENTYRECLRIGQHIGDQRTSAHALDSLGQVASKRGNFHDALEQYQASLKLMRASDDQRGIAKTLLKLGAVQSQLGEMDAAHHSLEQAAAIFTTLGDLSSAFSAHLEDAQALLKHDLPQARQALLKALTLAEQLEENEKLTRVLRAFAGWYQQNDATEIHDQITQFINGEDVAEDYPQSLMKWVAFVRIDAP